MAATLNVDLIGESGVGKSSILKQFVEGIFYCHLQSTIYVESDKKSIELKEINQSVNLNLFDITGRTELREYSTRFIKYADAIILCYDSTSKFFWRAKI